MIGVQQRPGDGSRAEGEDGERGGGEVVEAVTFYGLLEPG